MAAALAGSSRARRAIAAVASAQVMRQTAIQSAESAAQSMRSESGSSITNLIRALVSQKSVNAQPRSSSTIALTGIPLPCNRIGAARTGFCPFQLRIPASMAR